MRTGPRSTRAQLLRQLALKRKIQQGSEAFQSLQITNPPEAMFKVIGNTSRANATQMDSFPQMQGRIRLPTGGFDTLDGSRFKNQRTSSQTAEHGARSINKRI